MTLEGKNIYILGSGHFGQRSARLLQKRLEKGGITVVDHQTKSLAAAETMGCRTITMDAIAFLSGQENQIKPDDWIVPAVPIHLAYEWLRVMNDAESNLRQIPIPASICTLIPNPILGSEGQVYASIATFRCPEDCREPQNICTFTGKPRPQALWKTLSELEPAGYRSVCIVSHQLAPGVGGFQFKSLLHARNGIKMHPGKILLSTACKCHGVIHALSHAT